MWATEKKQTQTKGISSTFFWAAACLWTARAAHVAAAILRAALTATYAEENDEQEGADDDKRDGQPVWNRSEENINPDITISLTCIRKYSDSDEEHTVHDEFDFLIWVPCRVTRSIDGAEIHTVIPPHYLSDGQVGPWTDKNNRNIR